MKKILRFLLSEEGPTAVEYSVMMLLVFLVCLVMIRTLGL